MTTGTRTRRLIVGLALVLAASGMVGACTPPPLTYHGPLWTGGSAVGPGGVAQDVSDICGTPGVVMQYLVTGTADGNPVELHFEVFTTDNVVVFDETHLLGSGQYLDLSTPPCYSLKVFNVSPGRETVTFFVKHWYPYEPSYWTSQWW